MNLLEEYEKQQQWRHWEQYLRHLPVRENDHVIDLGCSVGGVSTLLSRQVQWVTGIDLNSDLIAHCQKHKRPNQSYICEDFKKVDYPSLAPITGIWSSFSLSYLEQPAEFLADLYTILEPDGWIALVDISCFVSGNMSKDGRHHDCVMEFEMNSWRSGVYDFDFGSKMKPLLKKAGFNIVHVDNNVSDPELNSAVPASTAILANWEARLERMEGLRRQCPETYPEICKEVMSYLGSKQRCKRNNVRFVVARKN